MNIDLLLTSQNEAGLLIDKAFPSSIAGVMFDAQTGVMTLEFGDAEPFEMNLPVEREVSENLLHTHMIHVGVIERGMIADSRQVPLVLQNDPFGGGNFGTFPVKPRNSVLAFETFMKRCSAGQPVHRDDVANELSAASIVSSGGMSAAAMQFAPHLSRQRALEAAPATPAPKGPSGPSGPGGAGGGGAVAPRMQQPRRPLTDDDE